MQQHLTLAISGLTCDLSRTLVAQALKTVAGVRHVSVDLESGRATVMPGVGVDLGGLAAAAVEAVEAVGFGARVVAGG